MQAEPEPTYAATPPNEADDCDCIWAPDHHTECKWMLKREIVRLSAALGVANESR